jgi:exosortase E/protease (VPEID-CTERM system)
MGDRLGQRAQSCLRGPAGVRNSLYPDRLNETPLPIARWVLLGSLLLLEGALLSARVDAAPLGERMPEWWATLLAHAGIAMPLATALVTAILLFAGDRLREEIVRAGALRWSWSFFAGHLIGFIAFFRLTVFVFGAEVTRSLHPGWWVAAWITVGLGAIACWVATAVSWRVMRPLATLAARILPASLVIGMVAWSAGQITEAWWGPLRSSTMWAVLHLLNMLTADAVVRPAVFVVGTKRFLVEIAPKCSGYEGIGLISVFVGVYLLLFRRMLRFPRAFLLLPLGIVAAWLLNALRIAVLVLLGAWVSPAIALGGFHAYSGSLLFCGLALGLAVVARRSNWFSIDGAQPAPRLRRNATAAYLAPLLAVVLATMLTGAASAGHSDSLYPVRVLAAVAALAFYWRDYTDLRWSWSWTAVAIGALAFVLWIAMMSTQSGGDTGAAAVASPLWLGCRVFGSVVMAPLVEELAFRGYLTRRLINAQFEDVAVGQFSWLSFLGSSLLFGAMHDRFVAGTLAGMLYAGALYRRRELGDAVLAHATTNALLTACVLATGRWSLWG